MKKLLAITATILALAFLCGCNAKKNELVGTWVEDNRLNPMTITFEFQGNGDFNYTYAAKPGNPMGNSQQSGKWERKDDTLTTTILLQNGTKLQEPYKTKYEITKVTPDELTLNDGRVFSFIRQSKK